MLRLDREFQHDRGILLDRGIHHVQEIQHDRETHPDRVHQHDRVIHPDLVRNLIIDHLLPADRLPDLRLRRKMTNRTKM